jgi:ATPase subunit of ABC transporter with duplicated ATPase domains
MMEIDLYTYLTAPASVPVRLESGMGWRCLDEVSLGAASDEESKELPQGAFCWSSVLKFQQRVFDKASKQRALLQKEYIEQAETKQRKLRESAARTRARQKEKKRLAEQARQQQEQRRLEERKRQEEQAQRVRAMQAAEHKAETEAYEKRLKEGVVHLLEVDHTGHTERLYPANRILAHVSHRMNHGMWVNICDRRGHGEMIVDLEKLVAQKGMEEVERILQTAWTLELMVALLGPENARGLRTAAHYNRSYRR